MMKLAVLVSPATTTTTSKPPTFFLTLPPKHGGVSVTAWISALSVALVALSLLILSLQTRAVAKQARHANELSGIEALNGVAGHLHAVTRFMLDHPSLVPYIDENVDPPIDGNDRRQVMLMAAMLSDVVELGLLYVDQLPAFASWNQTDWEGYALQVHARSPAVREIVRGPGFTLFSRLVQTSASEARFTDWVAPSERTQPS